jgi:hypothetical protein
VNFLKKTKSNGGSQMSTDTLGINLKDGADFILWLKAIPMAQAAKDF